MVALAFHSQLSAFSVENPSIRLWNVNCAPDLWAPSAAWQLKSPAPAYTHTWVTQHAGCSQTPTAAQLISSTQQVKPAKTRPNISVPFICCKATPHEFRRLTPCLEGTVGGPVEHSMCLLPSPYLQFFKGKTAAEPNGAVSAGRCPSVTPGDLAILVKCNTTDNAQTPETKRYFLSQEMEV